ncbi:MAG TPA: GntR family transcriptional regulator [Stellaceae bacterium]|nr:GntR family transcriptional regulator [Stellaceae bacterium]
MPTSAAAVKRQTPARPVDGRLPTPLYHQVYLVLRDKILSGGYGADGLLPGEPALIRQFGVSRITVKRALDDLATEGLVRRRRGLGTRVVSGAAGRPVAGNMAGLMENLIIMGLATEAELIEFDYVLPPEDVRRALDLAEGARAQRAVRVRSQEGVPFSYLTTHVPEPIGRKYGRKELAATPLLTLLERAGAVAASAEQALSARLADPTVAARLGVEVGSPLLSLTRVVYDGKRQPVEHIVALYRPDRFEYRMALAREGDGDSGRWTPPRAPRRNRRSRS